MTDTRDASLAEDLSLIDRAGEQAPKMLEKIFAAAQPGAVFGQPVESGSYTLITASEVTSGGGLGVGMGRRRPRLSGPRASSPSGGAALAGAAGPWGGRSRSLPSARAV